MCTRMGVVIVSKWRRSRRDADSYKTAYKGGVIKYETDRGGRDFEILLKNFVAQHSSLKIFGDPVESLPPRSASYFMTAP